MSLPLLGVTPILIAWLGWFWLFRELAARGRIAPAWQVSWALACLGWGVSLTLITELTSLAHRLNPAVVAVAWSSLTLGLGGMSVAMTRRRGGNWRNLFGSSKEQLCPRVRWWPFDVLVMLGGAAVVVVCLGFIAFCTTTTNGDSLTYHLPRVMHWLQNGSVEQFPTGNCRQNEFGPWSGYALAHLHLLASADRLFNMVQWFAMLTSVLLGAFVAKLFVNFLQPRSDLTAVRASAFAALLMASLPIGIVESITTQTDYTSACWFLTLVLFTLLLFKDPGNIWHALGAGAALGLGTLTKVTTLLYAAPLMVFLGGWLLFRTCTPRHRWQAGMIMTLLFVALNAPHMSRNFSVVGSPLSCPHILSIERNKLVTVSGTLSNLIRNLALHTNTGITPLTRSLNSVLEAAHILTGRDLNDPATTYQGTQFGFWTKLDIFDSYASCFPHLLTILAAVLIAVALPGRHTQPLVYFGLIGASCLLFCALLRWQPWHARIHLAYFIALLPCSAAILTARFPRWLMLLAGLALVHTASYSILHNRSRPILDPAFTGLPRERQYGQVHADRVFDASAQAIRDIIDSGATNIGLRLRFNDPEYLIWVLLQQHQFRGRVHHYMPFDASDKIDVRAPHPDVLITGWQEQMPHEYTNGFPHRVDYGWLKVLWSDAVRPIQKRAERDLQVAALPLTVAATNPHAGAGSTFFGPQRR